MRAIILAGGKGTRLAPYTTIFPKPLVPIGEMPILEIIVRQLARAGVTRATLTLGYLGELIRAYFLTHQRLAALMDIDYVTEETPTGTAGSVVLVPELPETFLVMNGDVLTTLDYRALIDYHREQGAAVTIATHRKKVKIDLGVLQMDPVTHAVVDYLEKPVYDYSVSMGVYVYDRRALPYIPAGQYFDFPSLVLKLIAAGEKVLCYPNEARWLDIGRHEDYAEAQRVFEAHRAEFGFPGETV
jgi:NDP-sugar pyrophosphorylase family protein